MANHIDLKTSGLDAAAEELHQVATRSADLSRPMRLIANDLGNSIRQNFRVGGRFSSADSILGGSNTWDKAKAPPTYKRSNKARGIKRGDEKGSTLLRSSHLMRSIVPYSDRSAAWADTNVEYAAIQNFGGTTREHPIVARHAKALAFGGIVVRSVQHPGSTLPARPYMVVQESDIHDAEAVLADWILR